MYIEFLYYIKHIWIVQNLYKITLKVQTENSLKLVMYIFVHTTKQCTDYKPIQLSLYVFVNGQNVQTTKKCIKSYEAFFICSLDTDDYTYIVLVVMISFFLSVFVSSCIIKTAL